jgi:5-formyltetrahydrofolate cyclo-ligase
MFLIEFSPKAFMKELTRMRHLQLRNSLAGCEIRKKSLAIKEKLLSLPEYRRAKSILFYASIGNEPATGEMIKAALGEGKKVAVPITSFRDRSICLSEIASLDDLEKKESGLIEPKKEKICSTPLEKIDLVVVPGVCFDLEGYRIGYGGGFYDRLLRKAPRKTVLVGLCFEENLEQRLPRQSHDAKINKIITEKRIVGVSE